MEVQRASSRKKLWLLALTKLPLLAMVTPLQTSCHNCNSRNLPRLAPVRLPQRRQQALALLLLPVRPVCGASKLLVPAAPAAMQWMTWQLIWMFQMAWQGSLAPLSRAAARSTQGTAELYLTQSATGAAGLLTTVLGPIQSPLLACICEQACELIASSPTGFTQMPCLAVRAPASCKTLGGGSPHGAAPGPRQGKLLMQKVIQIDIHTR